MNEPLRNPKAATGEVAPIFEMDMPCPQCGYNLRGICEPRCPECGEGFDPAELVKPFTRSKGPSLLWAMPQVLFRPRTFWSLPQVRDSAGPGWAAVYVVMGCNFMLGAIVLAAGETAWECDLRADPILRGLVRSAEYRAPGILLGPWIFAAGPFLLWLLQAVMCKIALAIARTKQTDAAARAVAGYSAVWTLLVAPALAGLQFWQAHQRPIYGVGEWVHVVGLLSLLLLATAIIGWAQSLYLGGRSLAAGNASCGLWCAASSILWCIAASWMYPVWYFAV